MSRRVRVDCTFEIEVEDLFSEAARSVEELRETGAQIRVVVNRAMHAVETAPGVTLRMWSAPTSPASEAD